MLEILFIICIVNTYILYKNNQNISILQDKSKYSKLNKQLAKRVLRRGMHKHIEKVLEYVNMTLKDQDINSRLDIIGNNIKSKYVSTMKGLMTKLSEFEFDGGNLGKVFEKYLELDKATSGFIDIIKRDENIYIKENDLRIIMRKELDNLFDIIDKK